MNSNNINTKKKNQNQVNINQQSNKICYESDSTNKADITEQNFNNNIRNDEKIW